MEINEQQEESKMKIVEEVKELGNDHGTEEGAAPGEGKPAGASNERRWVWAFPLIEGVPPSPRGGHTATLAGQSLIIFGGHYYSGKELGYIYLNDVHILDVNQNRWIVTSTSVTISRQKLMEQHQRLVTSTRQFLLVHALSSSEERARKGKFSETCTHLTL